MPIFYGNKKTLAAAPPRLQSASDFTRFRRLESEADVVPTRFNASQSKPPAILAKIAALQNTIKKL